MISTINEYLQDALTKVDYTYTLQQGQESDINIFSDRSSPLFWQLLPYNVQFQPIANQNRYIERHNLRLYVLMNDEISASNNDTFQIIKDTDELAQKWILQLYTVLVDSDQANIRSVSFTQVIKFKAHNIYSGTLINLAIEMPNDVDIC